MKRVQMIRGLGMTEPNAVAEAWARLKMQGYIVLDDPPPVVEVKCDDTGEPLWFVSFEVQERSPTVTDSVDRSFVCKPQGR